MRIIGAVDIGGTKIATGAVSEDGSILYRLECPTATGDGFNAAMQRTKAMLHEIRQQTSIEFSGIGVACPGPLDPRKGVIGDVGTLPGWQHGNIIEELTHEFGVPVALENDADAGALAEATWGTAANCGSFIYVTISTGIGVGMILSGELYRGVAGSHPEIGHQLIGNEGPLCYCGVRGCWESLASGPAMSAWIKERKGENLSAAEICELARRGDRDALECVDRESRYIGRGLANLVTMLVPDAIVLAGGVMRSADLLLEGAVKGVREIATQVPAEKTRITLASLGNDTGLAGAAMGWIHRYGGSHETAEGYPELSRVRV